MGEVIAPEKLSYIIGNPPFIGKRTVKRAKADFKASLKTSNHQAFLDFVAAWFVKAAK